MAQFKLSHIDVRLLDKYHVSFAPHPDVNIIVGINGSGKTTLLTEIENTVLKNQEECIYLPSVDNLIAKDGRKKSTALSQYLDSYIFDMKTGPSLMYYRMSMLDASLSVQLRVKERVSAFLRIVNSLLGETGKQIDIDGNKFIVYSDGDMLSLQSLSSGEKQLLLILLIVFLSDEKESIILIDEPENSLDISWQYKLINLLVELNPNAQFFITTHSPSIFGDGWGDKIIYMEDVRSKL